MQTNHKQQEELLVNTRESNVQMEKAIIGQILLHNEVFYDVVRILKSNDFYSTANKTIYEVMVEMFNQGQNIDSLTVIENLRRRNSLEAIGGPHYVLATQNNVVSATAILSHCRIVKQLSLKRLTGESAAKVLSESILPETDGLELLERWQSEVINLSNQLLSGNEKSWSDLVIDTVTKSLSIDENNKELLGIASGLEKLDKATLGFSSPDLIIIAARPGCGKTTLALQTAANIAISGVPVGFFSYEMSVQQLIWKILSSKLSMTVDQIRRGKYDSVTRNKLMKEGVDFNKWPIHINDNGSLTITELRAIANSWVRRNGVKVIFIDYLQLIKTYGIGKKNYNREQEVSYISAQLKAIAKDLEIPIVALAQLSREAERGKAPQLKDLRESGAIEQDADVVIFIYDDDKRISDINWNEDIEFRNGTPKPVFIDIQKFRLGTPKMLSYDFDRRNSKFKEFEPTPF